MSEADNEFVAGSELYQRHFRCLARRPKTGAVSRLPVIGHLMQGGGGGQLGSGAAVCASGWTCSRLYHGPQYHDGQRDSDGHRGGFDDRKQTQQDEQHPAKLYQPVKLFAVSITGRSVAICTKPA